MPPSAAALIAEQARALAKEHKLALVEDEALLAENAGLTEWPLVLMGTLRRGVPGGAGGMPDDVDEAAPEVLLAEASALGQARQPLPAGVQPARQGRRQGDRRRQREGDRARGCRTPSSSGSRT